MTYNKKYLIDSAFKIGLIKGELIDVRNVEIDNLSGAEMIIKSQEKRTNYTLYQLCNSVIIGDKSVNILYAVACKGEENAEHSFRKYIEYFRTLAVKAKVRK